MRRNSMLLLVVVLLTVPVFGQDRNVWRTAADIREGVSGTLVGTADDVNEGRNEIVLTSDNDRYGQITIVTDSVSTQYNGFGDVINGKPEIFVGGRGFGNVREGDRLEIRGVGRAGGVLHADSITLLGRSISAPQTGVGETRSPSSSGTNTPTVGSTATVYGRIEGVVRQVNAADNRVVVETDRREIFNIRASAATPVYYRGEVYQLGNLEPGDRVRIESDGGTASDREIRARRIDVIEDVQTTPGTGARVSSISGRVTRIDRTADVARIDTGRGEVRVDLNRAYDSNGRRVRAADLQVGDRIDISGNYAPNSDLFAATTVRFNEAVSGSGPITSGGDGDFPPELVTVSVSGTVTETLENSATVDIRDKATGRVIQLHVTEDFAVRTKAGGYTTADHLNAKDNILVKAYRDADGNYIAQTIRIR